MIKQADLVGLTAEQSERCEAIDRDVAQGREGVAAWHRLLDRRRLDRKLGLHPIAEFAVAERPAGGDQGTLTKRAAGAGAAARAPFYVSSEAEAHGLLLRCVGYLSTAAGEKFAFDKGSGGRDKMAEWIIKEIKDCGALAYIRAHAPFVFGIPLAVADS